MADRRNALVYAALSGGKSARSEPRGWVAGLNAVVAREGSVAGAARALDVPRTSLRRWLTGESQPPAVRRLQVERRASAITRRARLTPGREARILRAKTIVITAAWMYDVNSDARRRAKGKARTDNTRTIRFTVGATGSLGMDAQVRQALVTAFLDGMSGTDPGPGLFDAVAENMTDEWYRERFGLPADHGEGWHIEKVSIK